MNKIQNALLIAIGFSISYTSVYSMGPIVRTQSRAFSNYAGNTARSWFTRWFGPARTLEKVPFIPGTLEKKAIAYEKRMIEHDIAQLNQQLYALQQEQNKVLTPVQYWQSPKLWVRAYEYIRPLSKLRQERFSPDMLTIKTKMMEATTARNTLLNRLKTLEKGYRSTNK